MRRRGIGKRLVDAALTWALGRSAVRAELWVTPGNEAALRLFEQFEFTPTGDSEPLRNGSALQVIKMTAQIG
jgi:GNAT superfamily N-acetyltransferase